MSNERFELTAQPREIVGKKVKQLRAKGEIPAIIYGKTQEPVAVQIPWSNLRVALLESGGTGLIDVNVGSETYTTLVRVVDRHPVRQDIVLHVDFYAVNLTEKLVSTVPVHMINGEATSLRINGRVIFEATSIEVECLPTNIPDVIEVDTSVITEVGQSILVSDLPKIEDVDYITDPDTPIVRTDYFQAEPTDGSAEGDEDGMGTGAEPEVIARGREDEDEE